MAKQPKKQSAGDAQKLPTDPGDATDAGQAAESAIDNAQDAVDALKAEASASTLELPDFGDADEKNNDPAALALLRGFHLSASPIRCCGSTAKSVVPCFPRDRGLRGLPLSGSRWTS